jgi:hypothetical protein
MQSYAQALELYNSRPIPPRSKKWKEMPNNARPLSRTGDTHKGIHMTDEGVIYYRLYNTNIATLYPPQVDGTYRVECRWYDSQTTRNFMSDFGLYYTYLFTTDDTRVSVPLVPMSRPCADLTFTAENKLITTRSWHADIYTAVSSADDKQRRREFKAKLDTLTTLAMFKLENYRTNVTLESNYGAPFGGGWRNPQSLLALEVHIRDGRYRSNTEAEDYDFNDPEFIEKVLNAGQGVFDVLASKRAYNENAFRYYRANPEEERKVKAQQQQIVNDITLEDFSKSLHNKLLSLFNLKKGSDRKPWGQFQTSLPRKFFY